MKTATKPKKQTSVAALAPAKLAGELSVDLRRLLSSAVAAIGPDAKVVLEPGRVSVIERDTRFGTAPDANRVIFTAPISGDGGLQISPRALSSVRSAREVVLDGDVIVADGVRWNTVEALPVANVRGFRKESAVFGAADIAVLRRLHTAALTDLVILATDGAWRAGHDPQAIIDAVIAKQGVNEARQWPDWRTAEPDKAIEHIR